MAIQDDIVLFEQDLNDLIIKYEQYFLGLEKREPLKLLDDLDRTARRYMNTNIVNTMLKFKFHTLISRLNTYKQYWARITRLIEEGKYSRDKFKMQMHLQQPENKARPDSQTTFLSPDVERLYIQYVEARKACNLSVKNITPDIIAAAISKQKPGIINKYKCEQVEFKVVIEGGTPKIKARPSKTKPS